MPLLSIRYYFRLAYRVASRIYIFIFARPSTQAFNNAILQLALRGQGYNNCCTPDATGEALFIRMFAKTSPTLCIDVGANKGLYSKLLLSETRAKVIAFEPLPKAFSALLKLQNDYPERFEAFNMGIGSKEGTLELFYGDEDSELASFSSEVKELGYVGAHNVNAMIAPITTLDSFYLHNIKNKFKALDLLKIDTEGFEYEVLLGAQRIISEMKPRFIQIEYNWHQLFRNQSLRALAALMPNYTAYQMLPHGTGLVRRDLNLPEANIYHYSNFVFTLDDSPLDHFHETR